nr:hypothetical protein B0A51_06161 [Rachicladosporium sp. CCFEE 5018]
MASRYYGRRSDLATSLYGDVADESTSSSICIDSGHYRRRSDLAAALYGHEEEAQGLKGAAVSIKCDSPTTSSTEYLTQYQSSARAVFAICELLELILAHLDPCSIFRLQRIDKFWQHLIMNSKVLTRAMYLLPARVRLSGGARDTLQLHQPRYTHRMLQRLMAEQPFPYRNGGMVYFDVCHPNEAFASTQARQIGKVGKSAEQSQSKLVTAVRVRLFEAKPETTLAKLFITQPPCTQGILVWQLSCERKAHRHRKPHTPLAFATMNEAEGITAGHVYYMLLNASRGKANGTDIRSRSSHSFRALAKGAMRFSVRSAVVTSLSLVAVASALPASYSVVDVDGGSATDAASSQPTTIFQTVTAPSLPQSTKETTVLVTIVEAPTVATSTTSSSSTRSTTSITSTSAPVTSSTTSTRSTTSTPTTSSAAIISTSSTLLSTSTSITSTLLVPTTIIATDVLVSTITAASVTTAIEPTTTTTTAFSTTITTVINDTTLTIVSTLTATPSQSSTAYYDDGMWHTYYPIKTFETAVAITTPLARRESATATAAPAPYEVVSWEET